MSPRGPVWEQTQCRYCGARPAPETGERGNGPRGGGSCYFALAFCAAHRLRCASAIRLRASGLRTRFVLVLPAFVFFLIAVNLVARLRELASSERTCVSLAISASICATIESIAIGESITQKAPCCLPRRIFLSPNVFRCGRSLRFAHGSILIGFLQEIECKLLSALVGDEPFAIEIVLNAGQRPIGRAKIHQAPRAHTSKLRNLVQHRQLMAVDVGLVLFSPALVVASVESGLGSASKLADNERLLILDAPLSRVRGIGMSLVPPDILVESDYIQCLAERIVDDFGISFSPHQQSRSNEPRRIERAGAGRKSPYELGA